MTAPSFDHDDEYDDIDFADSTGLGCTWCLAGFTPTGTHPVIGLVYVACMHCTDICTCCGGIGLFPADTTCQHCLTEALTAIGYTATFCHTCVGMLTVEPTDNPNEVPTDDKPTDDPPWEVTS